MSRIKKKKIEFQSKLDVLIYLRQEKSTKSVKPKIFSFISFRKKHFKTILEDNNFNSLLFLSVSS